MCLYFYSPLTGLKNYTQETPSGHSSLSTILRKVLSEHYSIKQITPEMTVEAFSNFIDLIDPNKILISKEDLKKLNYPRPELYGEIQYNLVTYGRPSNQHSYLLRLMNERLESYIRKFLHNEAFRMSVVDRAQFLLKQITNISQERPTNKNEIESRIVDFLAFQLMMIAQKDQSSSTLEVKKSDLAFLIKSLRENIEATQENMKQANLEHVVAKSYLKTFDPHTDLFLPTQRQMYDESSGAGNKAKLGTYSQMVAEGIQISDLIKGSAADKSGLQKNDVIVAYETTFNSGIWFTLRNKTLAEYTKGVTGDIGTKIRLRIRRDNKEFETTVTRQAMNFSNFVVSTQGLRETPHGGPIVHIKLTQFSRDSAVRLHEEISKHLSKNLKGIVLDLRGNGGGILNEMSEILQLFVSKPRSMYAQSRSGLNHFSPYLLKPSLWDGPLVVLVDQGSASASEGLAAALKSYKRAIIVGGPHTYGKGSMQNFSETNKTLYKYTSALFYSPTGVPIQWRGVDVDITLPAAARMKYERDNHKSLNPSPLTGKDFRTYPIVAELDKISETLKTKLQQRQQGETSGNTPLEIYDQNTEEAYRILTDWVEIDPSGNGGW